jgi:hypothetical protein
MVHWIRYLMRNFSAKRIARGGPTRSGVSSAIVVAAEVTRLGWQRTSCQLSHIGCYLHCGRDTRGSGNVRYSDFRKEVTRVGPDLRAGRGPSHPDGLPGGQALPHSVAHHFLRKISIGGVFKCSFEHQRVDSGKPDHLTVSVMSFNVITSVLPPGRLIVSASRAAMVVTGATDLAPRSGQSTV